MDASAGPCRVLIVDDEAANRELVAALVRHRGHEALEAADGAEALEMVRRYRPALVVSDILMPAMDGFEFVRQLRNELHAGHTEVIFYTAQYREKEALALAESCGVTRVLVKPCEPEEILRAMDEALAQAPQPAAGPDVVAFDRDHLRLMTDKLSEQLRDLQASNARLDTLTRLHVHLASEHCPQALLDTFCRSARELVGASFAVLSVSKADVPPVISSSGPAPPAREAFRLQGMDRGVGAEVRNTRRAIRVADARAAGIDCGLPETAPAWPALVVPIMSLTHAYGWICLVGHDGMEFSDEDEQMVSNLAAQVGRIYENGSLYQQLRLHVEQLQVESAERERAVDRLRVSEAGLHRAQSLARLTHVIVGPEGDFESWPESLPRMVGLAPDAMFSTLREWLLRIHPEDQKRFLRAAEEARHQGVRRDLEYRLRRADGVWLHIHQVVEPLQEPGASGPGRRWFNTIQDISDQKQVVVELRANARELKALSARVLEAQETERRRVAHELHDELGQTLTAIKINLQSRTRFTDRSPKELDAENLRIVDDAIRKVRGLALALRPSMLDDLGLVPALQWIAEQTGARSGVQTQVVSELGPQRLSADIETTCFRVVQESLTNVLRHARARSVRIGLRQEGDQMVVSVRDDGVGFDLPSMRARAVAGGSIGVLGMQERAQLVGGRLDIHTEAGSGSDVVLRCPMRWREVA